ncbi:probable aspartic proteinase GIP2 [Eucalyptus grandis]|uniref:probable aspartic proteinase GIP2 n=1 Tax=Eucalyptus grandis TaxID=71139 RepID=UPI00192F0E95|nr:probable aspartic proteinase GIP2 [Eucalyptus grandis]
MSSPPLVPLFLFFGFILASSAMATDKPAPVVFPIKKDASTNQYYTTLRVGTPPTSMNAVLNLVGRFTWLDCDGYGSSSYHPIHCESSRCEAAGRGGCTFCFGPARPSCTNDSCLIYVATPFVEEMTSSVLGEDVLVLHSTKKIKHTSRSKFRALHAAQPPRVFALCLPSSSSRSRRGDLYAGGGPYMRPPNKHDLTKSLLRTRLLVRPSSIAAVSNEGDEYFINVTAIKIDSAPITFNSSILAIDKDGAGGTKFGTLTPYSRALYTFLHSAIFNPLVEEFTKKATDRKIKKATPVSPFGACFDARTVRSGVASPDVPAIVLVLRGDAQWRIEGANSMVRVSKDMMCLGFLDGGSGVGTTIEIGGHQMEDNLLEFAMGSSTFGFSNSLLLRNSSCSHL